jgi:hypothetical protein
VRSNLQKNGCFISLSELQLNQKHFRYCLRRGVDVYIYAFEVIMSSFVPSVESIVYRGTTAFAVSILTHKSSPLLVTASLVSGISANALAQAVIFPAWAYWAGIKILPNFFDSSGWNAFLHQSPEEALAGVHVFCGSALAATLISNAAVPAISNWLTGSTSKTGVAFENLMGISVISAIVHGANRVL